MNTGEKELLIQKYLEGSLNKGEEAVFKDLLRNDVMFKQSVEEFQQLQLGLEGMGMEMLQKEMRDWEHEYQARKKGKVSNLQKPVNAWRRSSLMAAVIAILLLSGIAYFSIDNGRSKGLSSGELFSLYYQPYSDMISERGDFDNEAEKALADAMDAYNKEAYDAAKDQLKAYMMAFPEDKGVQLYLGISYLETGQYNQARNTFLALEREPNYKQQAQWYFILTCLKEGNVTLARQRLEQLLSQDPPHYQKDTAKKLLEELQ